MSWKPENKKRAGNLRCEPDESINGILNLKWDYKAKLKLWNSQSKTGL
ncbi:hypothetical protein MmTuc01_2513 [Methanosarcina mazei Tuc01]|jgi:hypothetical protein|uniref:Uncharacterized protein n=1 Tax=Methanosarcina mazei Tuc01 TaxID=1236903 RepID=M1PZP6_METMZ|nr:hypothetical protein MmTuc01_2513 [Methanosarcina mazei Tuc01]